MAEPELESVSVSVMTGVRWSTLADGARFSAIKSQVRGNGASNPHATLRSIARGYLNRRHTRASAWQATKRVSDPIKRRYVRRCLVNLFRLMRRADGTPMSLPAMQKRKGPKGIIELKVAADAFLSGDESRYIGLWLNQDPLNAASARLYAQMMRESVAPPDDRPAYFEIIDLRRCTHFVHDVNELDDYPADLHTFLKSVEDDVSRAKLH